MQALVALVMIVQDHAQDGLHLLEAADVAAHSQASSYDHQLC